MNNGSLWSRQMDTRAQAGVGGGVMGSSILKKYPTSVFSVFNMVAILVYFALNRVRIEEFQQLAQPQQNFLKSPPPPEKFPR